MGCGCGSSKKAGGIGQKWEHLSTDGRVLNTYSSETDARMEAASQPGTRVRPVALAAH
jgi:hypothetical protein